MARMPSAVSVITDRVRERVRAERLDLSADPATAGIECIALSANALPEDVALTLASGAAAYWTKPLDAAAFTRGIDALFGPPPAP